MITLATRIDSDSDLLESGHRALKVSDLADTGVARPMPEARVAVVLRHPATLVRALVALDGQVDSILLVSGQAKTKVVEALLSASDSSHLLTDLPGMQAHPLAISPDELLGRHRETEPRTTTWLMTTSGTTGLPKIIPHTLASLSRTVVRPAKRPVWGMLYDGTRFAGMQLLLQGLIGGGRLAIIDTAKPLVEQISEMVTCGVDHLSATPTLWRRILMVPGHRDLPLTQITLGGEIADQGILTRLREAYPDARVTHIYAATETGVGFSVNDGLAGFPERFLNVAPGGVGVRVDDKGLWLRPPAHAARLAPPEGVLCDVDGYLFTGDQVERREDRVYFLGRGSGVINIGGVKVHPERIEAVIAAVPGVSLVRVGAKTNPFTGALVVATVQPQADQDETALRDRILETCRADLEREAVPAFVKFAADLEVNAAGKIVRDQGTEQK